MTTRQEREGNAKYQAEVLDAMMNEKHNKECADCGARGPRWASTNIGCFLCIRCSGIHRNLGTHISKVRSVTLDKWSKEQVDVFRELGNKRVNRYYEARIPEDYRHPSPSDDAGMEKFIRDKYEKKRWVSKTSNDRSPRREKERGRREEGDAPEDADVPRQSPPPQPQPTAALLFDMGGAPAVAQSQAVPMAGFQPVVSQSQAQSPQFPAFFGAAAPAPGSVAQHAPPQQQQPSLSKDALLSLYAPQPMAPSNQPTMGGGAHTGFHGHPNYNVHLMNQQAPMQQPQWGQQQQWGQQPQQPQYYAQQPMAQQGYYVAQQPQQLWK